MKKEKNEIEESLNEIRKAMEETTKKNDKASDNKSDVLLLKKIVSTSNIKNDKNKKNDDIKEKQNSVLKTTDTNTYSKKKNVKKDRMQKNFQKNSKRKQNDPISLIVEREIKPIIKKWINKNLRSFVKTIVIEEMKLISEATQKRTIK